MQSEITLQISIESLPSALSGEVLCSWSGANSGGHRSMQDEAEGGVAIKGRKIEVSYAFRVSFEQRAVHLQRCKLSKLTAWSIQDLPQMNLEWILFTSMILTTGRSVHTETLTARFSSCFYLMLRENTGLVKMSFFFTALELLHLLYHFTVLPEQW